VETILFYFRFFLYSLLGLLLDPRRLVILATAVVLFYAFVFPFYQFCPHCRRIVRRARQTWLRCPRCGREYHRTIRFRS